MTVVASKTYFSGAVVTLVVSFEDDGVSVDPSTNRLKTKDPYGNIILYVYPTSGDWTKIDTGSYELDIVPVNVGLWTWSVFADDPGPAIEEKDFTVIPSVLPWP